MPRQVVLIPGRPGLGWLVIEVEIYDSHLISSPSFHSESDSDSTSGCETDSDLSDPPDLDFAPDAAESLCSPWLSLSLHAISLAK